MPANGQPYGDPPRRTAYSELTTEELNRLLAEMMTDPLNQQMAYTDNYFSDGAPYSVNSIGLPAQIGRGQSTVNPSIVASAFNTKEAVSSRDHWDSFRNAAIQQAYRSRTNGNNAAYDAINKRELILEAARRGITGKPAGVDVPYIPLSVQPSMYPNMYPMRTGVRPNLDLLASLTKNTRNPLRD